MIIENKIQKLNEALSLIAKPTAKRLRLATEIVINIVRGEMKGFCEPSVFIFFKYANEIEKPLVTLKKFICAICPHCGSRTFDLNTEIMQGQCLSCSAKSSNYKADMAKRNLKLQTKTK